MLVGIMVLATMVFVVVAPFFLILSNRRLTQRIAKLETLLNAAGLLPDAAAERRVTAERPPERPVAPKEGAAGEPAEAQSTAREPQRQGLPAKDAPPKHYVFTADNWARLVAWLSRHWVSVIAALSLSFAGVFFVRYGIEHGLVPPALRIICGLVLGAALTVAGERLRRVGGSGLGTAGYLLPGTLCAGGVVSVYSAVLGARILYDLIGTEVAFMGLTATAALSVLLGLRHGVFLTVMGILCAMVAPFVIGGEAESITGLFYYFALIAGVAFATDSFQRTAWVSAVGLVASYGSATLVYLASPGSESHFLAFAALIGAATLTLPTRSLRPALQGGMVFRRIHRRGPAEAPDFPARLAMAGVAGLIGVAVIVSLNSALGFWLALGALAFLLVVLALWLETDVLDDAAPLVLLGILSIIGAHGFWNLEVARSFVTAEVGFEGSPPNTMLWLTAFGAALSLVAARKSETARNFSREWAIAAAAFAPATIFVLALWWQPLAQLSDTTWALHAAAIALVMTALAQRAFKRDPLQRFRASVFSLAALNMIAFAVSIVLTETALTLAFAAIMFSASWLDRRFDVPLLSRFAQVGVVVCSYRLLVDPGLPWALGADWPALILAFGGVITFLFAARQCATERSRTGAITTLESAAWSLPAILICLLIFRALDDSGDTVSHWALSLYAMIWLISGAVQAYRAKIDDALKAVRRVLAALFSGTGAVLLLLSLTIGSPLLAGQIAGPPLLDSLLVAYGLPALLILGVLRLVTALPRAASQGGFALAMTSAIGWIGLEVRRLWQGPDLTIPRVIDGELYTYTLALLIAGAALLLRSIQTASRPLRRVAMVVLGLTIAKVFLVDISGLEGLIRVVSFLVLGLTLAGLAWLDTMIGRRGTP
ncbi:MAG: DUF2339 domain-containing protein [Pseudomonadota bacterium]